MKNPGTNAHEKDKANPSYSKFYNKSGWLTQYALACGYTESLDTGKETLTLEKDSACYHVRMYDYKNYTRIFWDSFDTYKQAKKRFIMAIKKGNKK